jgi:hypothetical protein
VSTEIFGGTVAFFGGGGGRQFLSAPYLYYSQRVTNAHRARKIFEISAAGPEVFVEFAALFSEQSGPIDTKSGPAVKKSAFARLS